MSKENLIKPEELREMFGDLIPMSAVAIIMQDATDDRTLDDVRAELRALAASMKESKSG